MSNMFELDSDQRTPRIFRLLEEKEELKLQEEKENRRITHPEEFDKTYQLNAKKEEIKMMNRTIRKK